MIWSDVTSLVQAIVKEAERLCERHIDGFRAHVSYCAVFCQDDAQFSALNCSLMEFGVIASETPTGPVFIVPPIDTVAGDLRIVKARRPDVSRPEQGDADFALENYSLFKGTYLSRAGFKLIVREHFEMIELTEPGLNVRAYFSNPPVEEHPGIADALKKF